jgi:Tfp pilus assembly protein PilW
MLEAMKLNMRGESMVSLLVGLAVGLLVLTGGVTLWINTLKSQRIALQINHLNQDLRSAMDWMAQDIRRAQYVNAAWRSRISPNCNDDFCGAAEDFSVSANQIEFSWDRNDNGIKDNKECTGFLLKSSELKVKTSCAPAVWSSAITDAGSIKITALQFTLRCSAVAGTLMRHIDLQMTAALPNDPLTTVTHQQSVALRNALPVTNIPGECT